MSENTVPSRPVPVLALAGLLLAGLGPRLPAQDFEDLAVGSGPARAEAAPGEPYRLAFSLKGKVRGLAVDADFWAGAELDLAGRTDRAGRLQLDLVAPRTAPWRFYWYKLPLQSPKAGYSCEVSPAAGTWPARKAAEDAAERHAREVHRTWQGVSRRRDPLDYVLRFLVIGDPAGRFGFPTDPRGGVGEASNRMTGRWLPRGWDDWVAGRPEEGYGFWEVAEAEPSFAPRLYAGLAKALGLLAAPALPAGPAPAPGARYALDTPGVTEAAFASFETMVPKAAGQFSGGGSPRLEYRAEGGPRRGLTVEGDSGEQPTTGASGVRYRYRRTLVRGPGAGPIEANRASFEAWRSADERLEVEIGYRTR